MQIVIEIPKEFESHFEFDRFADSLARVASDIEQLGFRLSGRYERETITMIRKAIENGKPLPKRHGALKDVDAIIAEHAMTKFDWSDCIDIEDLKNAPTILEADKEVDE